MAPRDRPSGGGLKPPGAALAEDCRGERSGKRRPGGVRRGLGRRCAESARSRMALPAGCSPLRRREGQDGIGTGAPKWSRDEPGGCPGRWPGGARRIGGASLVCGVRVERRRAGPGTAAPGFGVARGEPASVVTARGARPLPGWQSDRLVVAVILLRRPQRRAAPHRAGPARRRISCVASGCQPGGKFALRWNMLSGLVPALIRHCFDRGSGSRGVEVGCRPGWLQRLVIKLVTKRNPGRNVEPNDFLIRNPVEMLLECA